MDNRTEIPLSKNKIYLLLLGVIIFLVGGFWMFIYPEKFTYRLIRQGREFKVDFDLTKPITPPSAPWGYSD